ncbi:galactokinase [Candidatus Epulonipiscium viviparus]|uniref:galactokinase n=1 Tax=Candidatus Epulonipiscium viviparus TaxID=420336 RepID=UPI0004965059|nr:galactokinase [Candidatus Epulopiscium viviparus]
MLQECFVEVFNKEPEVIYFSPGRINLIGEHIDYNGGLVFPCPITLGTYAAVARRDDKTVRCYSKNFEDLGIIEFNLDHLDYDKKDNWTNYAKGVAKFLLEKYPKINSGFDAVVYGNIPNGSGLSSSASLELLIIQIFKSLFNLPITEVDAALLGKKVENEYIGVNSGIMDQFAISLGKKDKAILLDCNSLDFTYIPVDMPTTKIVIMNTNKRRELADSKYNERRAECESALAKLQSKVNAENLCEIDLADLKANKDLLTENEYKRACHAITENIRTKASAEAFKNNDLVEFGKLLNASHKSLKEDYEVTGIELDTLVAAAQEQPGTLGARMTGAGFGGCSLAIVENDKIEAFVENVGKAYLDKIGYAADFYIAKIGDGPTKVEDTKNII